MSILGVAILGITGSNFKMAKIDSRSQSAYYIAEAGINYMIDEIYTEVYKDNSMYESNEDFFRNIEEHFINYTFTLNNFEENNKLRPNALITVSWVGGDGDKRDYLIFDSCET